ncbi:hypothetical protein [Neptuniibacter sp. QD37_11]|uniref:hypothetical protein n=1 Tax=Neptuniibacter sp. QD37_11 TaxID=3398209 RepID=UPI0039F531F5
MLFLMLIGRGGVSPLIKHYRNNSHNIGICPYRAIATQSEGPSLLLRRRMVEELVKLDAPYINGLHNRLSIHVLMVLTPLLKRLFNNCHDNSQFTAWLKQSIKNRDEDCLRELLAIEDINSLSAKSTVALLDLSAIKVIDACHEKQSSSIKVYRTAVLSAGIEPQIVKQHIDSIEALIREEGWTEESAFNAGIEQLTAILSEAKQAVK